MGKLIANIALTGGPCAGKTTTINCVKDALEKMGYHVLLLNECATELINGGIRPFGDNSIPVFDFQNEILNLQLYKERRYLNIVEKLPVDTKCVILSDRGFLDSKAYLGDELFAELLEKNNLDEENLCSKYDMVIHMVTVAADIKNKYNNSTNSARFEDAEEAIDIDSKTGKAWSGHSNLIVIEATETIDEKIKKVQELICNFVKNCE